MIRTRRPVSAPAPTRRAALGLLAATAFAPPALAQPKKPAPAKPAAESDHGWWKLRSDEGKPFPNLPLPSDLAADVERLPGLIRAGAAHPDVTIVEFFDFNCGYCRAAARALHTLLDVDPDLRLGLVNNPILSPASKDAAKVEMAVIKLHGGARALALHGALLGLGTAAAPAGRIDGPRALDAAAALGLDRQALARAAETDPEIAGALDRQMRLADSLALSVTPSFVVGRAGIVGYPGPKAMAAMVTAMRRCEAIACG